MLEWGKTFWKLKAWIFYCGLVQATIGGKNPCLGEKAGFEGCPVQHRKVK